MWAVNMIWGQLSNQGGAIFGFESEVTRDTFILQCEDPTFVIQVEYKSR